MDLGLSGLRAVVTGGSRGIGKAIVTRLAEEGARVAFCGRSESPGRALEAQLSTRGLMATFVAADTETDAGIDRLAAQVLDAGPVDILVNNVGGSANPEAAGQGFLNIPTSEWMQTYYKCVVGAVRLIDALVPSMRERGWGRVINISSAGGLEPPDNMPAEYAAAKAAMNTMTMSLSRTLARTGVTVNTVTPGPVLTEGFQSWMEQVAKDNGWGTDLAAIEKRFVTEVLPLTAGRLGRPADIASAVAYIASVHSDFVTGSNFRVDGGLSRAAL